MERRAVWPISWPIVMAALLEACGTLPGDSDAGSSGDTSTSTAPADSAETVTSTPITATSSSFDSDTSGSVTSTSFGSDTSADGSSGAPLPAACLPAEVHGGVLLPELSIPGLNVYEGCDLETWVVEHLGAELQTTVDEINATRDQGTLFPGATPGLFGVGTGLCCDDPDLACITLYVLERTDLPTLVAYIDASFPDGLDACFGLRVLISDPPVPG